MIDYRSRCGELMVDDEADAVQIRMLKEVCDAEAAQ